MKQRLFSVFEDADESLLLQQCEDDLAAWGFDSLESRTLAAQILQGAKAAAAADVSIPFGAMTPQDTSNGVTVEDAQWYWNLPQLARAVMLRFDEAIHVRMWLQCHRVNLCIEDLERDLRQRLPAYGNAGTTSGDDSPLPWELRRRFARYIAKIRQNEEAWREWGERSRRAPSMNALIREEVRAGHL